jgi:3-methyl-2-oxobutanoate hydroxymethyltransferase
MPRIFDYGGREVERTTTVGALVARRGSNAHSAQITAETAEEGAAAEAAGIEMIVCREPKVAQVREGTTRVFVTAAIDFSGAVSDDEMLRTAYAAMNAGADAIITGRRPQTVRRLTEEHIPVMGHLGFIPRDSTLYGGIRAIGKTADEAIALWDQFRRLEDAGAFGARVLSLFRWARGPTQTSCSFFPRISAEKVRDCRAMLVLMGILPG